MRPEPWAGLTVLGLGGLYHLEARRDKPLYIMLIRQFYECPIRNPPRLSWPNLTVFLYHLFESVH
jgi:hypothetical protein